jgi:Tfp pilus assembly protein PilV
MKKINSQAGFSAVEAVLLLVILGIIGFAGYEVMNAKNSVSDADSSISTTQPSAATQQTRSDQIPAVNSAADLNKAEQSLDQMNLDDNSGDTAQLSTQTANF